MCRPSADLAVLSDVRLQGFKHLQILVMVSLTQVLMLSVGLIASVRSQYMCEGFERGTVGCAAYRKESCPNNNELGLVQPVSGNSFSYSL